MTTTDETIGRDELQRRVVHSLLLPAVRLAKVFGIPLKEMVGYLQLAYYHELRKDGLRLKDVSDQMDISMRSAARLSKQLKTNFFRPEREHGLPRQIEFVLWHEALSLPRLKRELTNVSGEAVEEALEQLLSEDRVSRIAGRTVTYGVTRGSSRLVRDRWTARIGALNSMVSNICDVVYGRFFTSSSRSWARTLSLRVRPEDLGKLKALYEDRIWTELSALDEAAAGDPAALSINLTVCWADYESTPRAPDAGSRSKVSTENGAKT